MEQFFYLKPQCSGRWDGFHVAELEFDSDKPGGSTILFVFNDGERSLSINLSSADDEDVGDIKVEPGMLLVFIFKERDSTKERARLFLDSSHPIKLESRNARDRMRGADHKWLLAYGRRAPFLGSSEASVVIKVLDKPHRHAEHGDSIECVIQFSQWPYSETLRRVFGRFEGEPFHWSAEERAEIERREHHARMRGLRFGLILCISGVVLAAAMAMLL